MNVEDVGAPDVSIEDLLLDGRVRLEDLVDRDALDELCRSFFALFGIPVRIYSTDGALLADAAAEQELCAYVNAHDGRAAGLRDDRGRGEGPRLRSTRAT